MRALFLVILLCCGPCRGAATDCPTDKRQAGPPRPCVQAPAHQAQRTPTRAAAVDTAEVPAWAWTVLVLAILGGIGYQVRKDRTARPARTGALASAGRALWTALKLAALLLFLGGGITDAWPWWGWAIYIVLAIGSFPATRRAFTGGKPPLPSRREPTLRDDWAPPEANHGWWQDRWDDRLTTIWKGQPLTIEFTYQSTKRERLRRTVDLAQVSQAPGWRRYYLTGFCHTRRATRTFRAERIQSLILDQGERYDPWHWIEQLAGIDIRAHSD